MSQFSSLSDEFYNMATPVTRKVGMTQAVADNEATTMMELQATPAEEPLGVGGYAKDIGLGVIRGAVGAAADIADLAVMPFSDYDVPDYFGVMDPAKTMAGGVTEGIANFLTGFIPGVGIAGKIGKIGKIGQLTKSVDTAIDVARASGYAKKAIALKGAQAFVKGSVAGAIADFGAFDGHEARLSNLLREHAGWTDPFTAYLAADENDGEIEGRLKNAIEGTIIGGLTEGVFNAFRMYKAGYFAKSTGLDPNAAMATEAIKIRGEQRNLIKTSFNLTDEQAEATNILIDRMGLDRSKIKVQTGAEARETYDEAALVASEPRLIEWDKAHRMAPGETVKVYRGLVPSTERDISTASINGGDFVTTDLDKASTYAGRKNRFATDERGQITGRLIELEVDSGDLVDLGKGNLVYAPNGFDIGQIRQGATNRTEGLRRTLRERLGGQTSETEVRGFASFAEDGKSIIGGLTNPDVGTAIEEITHVARRQLFDKSIPPTSRFGIQDRTNF